MNRENAEKLIKTTFEQPFDEDRYSYFIRELLNQLDESKAFTQVGAYIADAFKSHVRSFKRLGTYTDPDGEEVDVLVVYLRKESAIDRARTMQRNFVARHLNKRNKEAALVAYASPDLQEWRFSIVRLEYQLVIDEKTGKVKLDEALTPSRRYSFLVGANEPNHTAQQQLIGILADDAHNPSLAALEEAFNIEVVTNKFFDDYKERFLELKEALDKLVSSQPRLAAIFSGDGLTTANFSKRLMGQIVFLYFLQKKGWLGVRGEKPGPKNFLRQLYDKEWQDYQNFYNEILEPLFYEALAIERPNNYYEPLDCKIPFLNGGLFDSPLGYNWQNQTIQLPNNIFGKIFDTLDLYNFTVREDEPLEKEVAVDPEMLGKVFERLLEVNDRKSQGAFYTPREIVHYMCRECLINYLNSTLNQALGPIVETELVQKEIVPKEDIEKFIRLGEFGKEYDEAKRLGTKSSRYTLPNSIQQYAYKIDQALANVKICDPAVGSGAFPVGMLQEIVRSRQVLSAYLEDHENNRSVYKLKHHAIQNGLYGVDIDASAVDIAKLRLWLSLVVEEEEFAQVKPLPNLFYKIVTGNSLLSYPYQRQGLEKLEALKDKYFNASYNDDKQNLRRKIEQELFEIFKTTKKSLGYQVSVDFKINFSEVFRDNGGFDIIIGNPPYIKEYTSRSAFDGLHSSPYYQGKMDIWYLFACISIDILRKKTGIISFIATNNWLTNEGASILREKVVRDTTLLELIDFGNFKIFEQAGIQTMIMVLRRDKDLPSYNFDFRRIISQQTSFADVRNVLAKLPTDAAIYLSPTFKRENYLGKLLVFSDNPVEMLLEKIVSKSNFKLDARKEVAQGIVAPQDNIVAKTKQILGEKYKIGDGIFYLSTAEKDALLLNSKELDLIKPLYTTSELHRYYGDSRNQYWVIYTNSSFKHLERIHSYPNIKKHLDQFQSVITSDNRPYGLHRSRNDYFFKGEKIISLRKCLIPTFTYTDFDCYVSQTFYIIKTFRVNMRYLTGLLNSKLIQFWLKHRGKMQGSHYQVDKAPLLDLPLIVVEEVLQNKIDEFVSRIINQLQLNISSNIMDLETSINQLVYQIYKLTPEEISLIEDHITID